MSSWRRHALALLPERRRWLEDPQATVYDAFSEVSSAFQAALVTHDLTRIDALLGFGEWALRQRAEHVWNPAGVRFLEHIFDEPGAFPLVAPRLPLSLVREVGTLWEGRLTPEQSNEVQRRLKDYSNLRLSGKQRV